MMVDPSKIIKPRPLSAKRSNFWSQRMDQKQSWAIITIAALIALAVISPQVLSALLELQISIVFGVFGLLLLVPILIIYFIPTLIAKFIKGKRNWIAIGALNFFAGWTFIGWVGALVWSLTSDHPT